MNHKEQPTVILAKTIKGYGTGAGEAKNTAHNTKKVDVESLRHFRDRFDIPVKDADLENLPFFKPEEGSAEAKYLAERRAAWVASYHSAVPRASAYRPHPWKR